VRSFHGIVTGHAHPSAGIRSIYDILGITVRFGIAVICCGLLFNWINLFKKQRWIELIFDKGGILGGWMYGGGIYCGWYMVVHDYRALPGFGLLLTLLGLPALLLFCKGPIHAREKRSPPSPTLFFYFIMEWVVEMLEIFSGYLSNTLSFMRVAGLGIAHVSLMVSFFTMADMVRGDDPGIAASIMAVLLLITGNIMVIAFEGLSAGIQALRLNYYEFFTKFFHGTGKLFNPIGLQEQHYL
jgi:V/A-type H+-transporting ATPase subunit I